MEYLTPTVLFNIAQTIGILCLAIFAIDPYFQAWKRKRAVKRNIQRSKQQLMDYAATTRNPNQEVKVEK